MKDKNKDKCECKEETPALPQPARTTCAQKWFEAYQEYLCEEEPEEIPVVNWCEDYDHNKIYLNYYNPYGDDPKKKKLT